MRKGLLTALLVLVLLVAYIYLGRGYLGERRQYEDLNQRIAETAATLANMPAPAPDLEVRLATAQADLAATGDEFPDRIDSTQVINAILELAEATGVRAIPLLTQPWRTGKTGEHNYCVLRLNVSVTGDFARLTEFTRRLETGDMPTLVIEQMDITLGNEPSPESGKLPASASIDLAVYTRPALPG